MKRRIAILVALVASLMVNEGTLEYIGGEGLIFPFEGLSAHTEVAVDESYAYAYVVMSSYVGGGTNDLSTLSKVDVADPTKPQIVASVELPPDQRGVVVKSKNAYVGGYNMTPGTISDGLRILDKTSLNLVGGEELALPGHGQGVQVLPDESYAFISFFQDNDEGTDGFRSISLFDPTNPVVVGGEDLPLPKAGRPVFVLGDYAYLPFYQDGPGTNGLRIVDISDPTVPTVVGGESLVLPAHCRSIFVSEGLTAYLVCEGREGFPEEASLIALDVKNSGEPRILSSVALGAGSRPEVFVSGKYLYLAREVWDISNPTNLVKIGKVANREPAVGNPWGNFVSGGFLYVGYQGDATYVVQDALRIFKAQPSDQSFFLATLRRLFR